MIKLSQPVNVTEQQREEKKRFTQRHALGKNHKKKDKKLQNKSSTTSMVQSCWAMYKDK